MTIERIGRKLTGWSLPLESVISSDSSDCLQESKTDQLKLPINKRNTYSKGFLTLISWLNRIRRLCSARCHLESKDI